MMIKSILRMLLASLPIRAQLASTLFEHATIITFNPETKSTEVLHDTSLLIQDDTIAAIFPSSSNTSIPLDTEIVQARDTIISPGFIDTHRHTWQTAYRTIAPNITLAEYFVRYGPVSKAVELFSAEDIYLSSRVGLHEALNAGVTSLLDQAHAIRSRDDAEAGVRAYLESGARVWFGYSLDPHIGMSVTERAAHYLDLERDERLAGDLVKLGVSFDSWHGVEETDLDTVVDLIQKNNPSVVTSHWIDGAWKVPNSPSHLLSLGLLNLTTPIVLSHATFLHPAEHQLLRDHNQYISITPESEMHFGHSNTESDLVMDQASLGVDTHATYSGDIVTQARLWLQSVRHRAFRRVLEGWKIPRYSPMSANQAFYLATRAGALALRREDLGVVRVGAKADLVVFDGHSANMVGWRDPVAAVMLHSNAGDVKHVMVGGRFVKRNGTLVARDLESVTEAFATSAKRIQEKAVRLEYDMNDESMFNTGLPFGYPDQVDAVRGDGTGY